MYPFLIFGNLFYIDISIVNKIIIIITPILMKIITVRSLKALEENAFLLKIQGKKKSGEVT